MLASAGRAGLMQVNWRADRAVYASVGGAPADIRAVWNANRSGVSRLSSPDR